MSTPDPFAQAEAEFEAAKVRRPGAPRPDPFAAAEAEFEAQQQQPLQLGHALTQNPDEVATNFKNARTAGVSPSFASQAPAETALLARQSDINAQLAKSPTTRQAMQDPRVAALSHDDVENLGLVETVVNDLAYVGRSIGTWPATLAKVPWQALNYTAEQINTLARTLPGPDSDEGSFMLPIASYAQSHTRSLDEMNSAIRGRGQGTSYVGRVAASGVAGVGNSLAALGVGFLARNPAAAYAVMGGTTGLDSYTSGRQAGLNVPVATLFGGAMGLAEVTGEALPMQMLLKDLKAGSPFWKTLLHQMATEVPTEVATTLTQNAIEWAYLHPEKSVADWAAEQPQAVQDTVIATVAAVGLQTSMTGAVDRAMGRPLMGEEAKQTRKLLELLAARTKDSKLHARSAEDFASFVQQAGTNGAENVYIQASRLADVLHQSGMSMADLETLSPEVARQFEAANQAGGHGDLVIPLGEFTAKLSQTELGTKLLDHARLREDARSTTEIAEDAEAEKAMVAEAEQKLAGASNRAAMDSSIREVTDHYTDAMDAPGWSRLSGEQRRSALALLRAYYLNLSAITGRMPADILHGSDGKQAYRFETGDPARDGVLASPDGLNALVTGTSPRVPLVRHELSDRPFQGLRNTIINRFFGRPDGYKNGEGEPLPKNLPAALRLPDGTTADYSAMSVKKLANLVKDRNPETLAAIFNLQELLDKAVLLRRDVLAKDEETGQQRVFDYWTAMANFDGKDYAAVIMVRKDSNGNTPIYSLAMVTEEEVKKALVEAAGDRPADRPGLPTQPATKGLNARVSKILAEHNAFLPGGVLFQDVDMSTWTPLPPDQDTIEVDGVTRSTVNSDFAPIHWSVEGITNFWRNLGGTLAVDAIGRPVVVHHGTADKLYGNVMRKDLLGSNTGAHSAREGFFFSGNYDTASSEDYTRGRISQRSMDELRDEVGQVYEAAHDVVNTLLSAGVSPEMLSPTWEGQPWLERQPRINGPWKLVEKDRWMSSAPGMNSSTMTEDDATYLADWGSGLGASIDLLLNRVADGLEESGWKDPNNGEMVDRRMFLTAKADFERNVRDRAYEINGFVFENAGQVYSFYLNLANPLVHDMQSSSYREVSYHDLIIRAKQEGRDGVIIKNTYDGGPLDDIYVAFEPNQIKSATNNSGKFDTNQAGFLHQLGGLGQREANNPRFQAWARAPLYTHDTNHTWDGYTPAVFEAYHASTHDIPAAVDVNKNLASEDAWENWLGAGFYLTSDTDDASDNYAGKGIDLRWKLDAAMDALVDEGMTVEDLLKPGVLTRYAATPAGRTNLEYWAERITRMHSVVLTVEELIDNQSLDPVMRQWAVKAFSPGGTIKESFAFDVSYTIAKDRVFGDNQGNISPYYVRFDKALDLRPRGAELEYEYVYADPKDPDSDIIDITGDGAKLLAALDRRLTADGDLRAIAAYDNLRDTSGFRAGDLHTILRHHVAFAGQVLQEAAREAGFDGMVMDAGAAPWGQSHGLAYGTLHFVPFVTQNLKSSIGNSGAYSMDPGANTLEQRGAASSLRFNSPLYMAFLDAQPGNSVKGVPTAPKSGTGQQWIAWLDSMQSKGRLRAEERHDVGIDNWLRSKKGLITYNQAFDYFKDNQVTIEVISLDSGSGFDQDKWDEDVESYVDSAREAHNDNFDPDEVREEWEGRRDEWNEAYAVRPEVDDTGEETDKYVVWETGGYLREERWHEYDVFASEADAIEEAMNLNDVAYVEFVDDKVDAAREEHENDFDESYARDDANDTLDRDDYSGSDTKYGDYVGEIPEGENYAEHLFRFKRPSRRGGGIVLGSTLVYGPKPERPMDNLIGRLYLFGRMGTPEPEEQGLESLYWFQRDGLKSPMFEREKLAAQWAVKFDPHLTTIDLNDVGIRQARPGERFMLSGPIHPSYVVEYRPTGETMFYGYDTYDGADFARLEYIDRVNIERARGYPKTRANEFKQRVEDLRNTYRHPDVQLTTLDDGNLKIEVTGEVPSLFLNTLHAHLAGDSDIVSADLKYSPEDEVFRDGHWSDVEQDVLAHIRVDVAAVRGGLPDGPHNIFRIQEFQSDPHQRGQEKGYVPRVISVTARQNAAGEMVFVETADTGEETERLVPIPSGRPTGKQVVRANNRVLDAAEVDLSADMPFKKSWTTLSLRYAMEQAVAGNHKYIAWTIGETQVKRWSQAVQAKFDTLELIRKFSQSYGGEPRVRYELNGFLNGVRETAQQGDAQKMKELLGAKMLDALVADMDANEPDVTKEASGVITGTDMVIGGSGITKFYDERLVNEFNALYKKYGIKAKRTTVYERMPQGVVPFTIRRLTLEEKVNIPLLPPSAFSYDVLPDLPENAERFSPRIWSDPDQQFDGLFDATGKLFSVTVSEHQYRLMSLERRLSGERYELWVAPIPQALADDIKANNQMLYQADEQPKAAIQFLKSPNNTDAFARIYMGAKSDYSSFVHETAHFMLEVYADLVRTGQAPQDVIDDMNTLLRNFGYSGSLEDWVATSVGQRRALHEKFARTLEAWTVSGRAPSAEMSSLFARIRNYMLDVYKNLRNARVRVDPEVEGVMSRMLAGKEAVRRMTEARAEVALFKPMNKPAGLSDDDWREYEAASRAADEYADQSIMARTVRDMKWLSNAKSKVMKALQNTQRSTRAKVKQEVEEELAKQPVYRAMLMIAKGQLPDGADLPRAMRRLALDLAQSTTKLSTAKLRELQGDGPAAPWRYLPTNMLAAENGADPAQLATLAGFGSADEMVKAMVAAPKFNEAAEAHTDRRMNEEHADLLDPAALSKAADEAVHNAFRERFLASELRALERAAGNRSVESQTALALGKRLVAQTVYGELRYEAFAKAAANAANAVVKLFAAGKTREAANEKRNQLVNFAAARESLRVAKEIDRLVKRVTKNFNKADWRKDVGQEALDQMQTVLERFGLIAPAPTTTPRTVTLADFIAAQDALGIGLELSPEVLDESFSKPLTKLTTEQALDVMNSLRRIEQAGRHARKLVIAGRKQRLADIKKNVLPTIALAANGREVDNTTRNTTGNKLKRLFRGFLAAHRKFASQVFELDNFARSGPLWDALVRPMNLAGAREATMRGQASERLAQMFEPLRKGGKLMGDEKYVQSMGRSFTREERIVLALNVGNEGNLQRLMDGAGYTAVQVNDVLDLLTSEEWAFVQQVWDLFDSYRPQIKAKELRVSGLEPSWVEPRAVTTKFGVLRGGYYPVKYDQAVSPRAEAFADSEDAKQLMRAAFTASTTRRSFTKSRAAKVTGRPLVLTFAGLDQGINEVIHDLCWHEWVISANMLLGDIEVDQAIRSGWGAEWLRAMKDTVKAIATEDQQQNDAMGRILGKLRANTTMVGLGFNLVTAAMQVTGFSQSAVRIGPKWLAKGLREYISAPRFTSASVRERSEFMANRMNTMQREINELLNSVSHGDAKAKLTAASMVLIAKFQQQVDMPTWLGAYYRAYAEQPLGMSEEEVEALAVAAADQAVVDAQGGGQVKDLAGVQRGNTYQKLFTNFYSFFNVAWNMNVEVVKQRAKAGQWVGMATDLALINILPAVLTVLIKEAITAGGGDDDDTSVLAQMPGEVVSFALSQLVGVREMAAGVRYVTDTSAGADAFMFDYSGPAGLRFFAEFGKLMKQVAQGELDAPAMKAALNVAGLVTGIPTAQLARTLEGAAAMADGETDDPRALITGKPR